MPNGNNQPFWQTRPRITKAQEKFLREYRRTVTMPLTPEAKMVMPERRAREQQEERRRQVEEIEARPGARSTTGMLNPRVVSRAEIDLIAQYQSQQPEELTRWQQMKPRVTWPETGLSAGLRGLEASAETGLSAFQTLYDVGPRIPAILPFGPSEESLERSRESMRDIGAAFTGQQGISETFRSLAERQRERPFGEQIAAGAVFDPLNLLPGIGFGPDIIRGLNALSNTRPAVTTALRETIQQAPRTLSGMGDAVLRTLDDLGEGAPALRKQIRTARLRAGQQVARVPVPGMGELGLKVGGIRGVAGGAIRTATGETPARITKFVEPSLQKRFKDIDAAVENVGYKMDAFAGIRDDEYFIVLQRPRGVADVSRMSEGLREFTLRERPRVPRGEPVPDRLSFKTFDDVDNFLKTGEYTPPSITSPVRKGPFKKTYETVKPRKAAALKRPDYVGPEREAAPTPRAAPAAALRAGRESLEEEIAQLEKKILDGQSNLPRMEEMVRRHEAVPFEIKIDFQDSFLPDRRTLKPGVEEKVYAAYDTAGIKHNLYMPSGPKWFRTGLPMTRGARYTPRTAVGTEKSLNVLSRLLEKIEGVKVGKIGPSENLSKVRTELMDYESRIFDLQDSLARDKKSLESVIKRELSELEPTTAAAPTPTTAARTARAATPSQRIPGGPRATPLEPRKIPPRQPLVEGGPRGEGKALPSGRTIGGPGRGSGEPPYRDADAMFQDGLYPESDPFMATWKSKGSRVLEEVYDRNFPLKALEKQSGVSAHQYAQLVPGAMGAGEDTVRRLYKPIIDSLRSADLPLLEKYMVLMRGGDITALKVDALLPGGITNAERLRLLEEMPAQIGAKRFRAIKNAADDLWGATGHGYGDPDLMPADGNILELLNEGIISKEMYTAMKADHPHYIPWQRADFDISDFIEKSFSAKPEANLSTTGIRKMAREGSTRALSDPLNKLLAEPYRIKTIIFRNRAAKSIVRALEEIQRNTGEELVRYIDPKREMRIVERVTGERIPRKVKGEISQQWETISFFEDGVKNRVQVPSVYGRVAKGLEAEPGNFLVTLARISNAPLRYGATTFNPLFLPTNIIRDGMSAMFREKVFPFIGKDYLAGIWAVMRKNALYSEAAQSGALLSGIVENMNPTRFRVKATRSTEAGRLGLMGAITIPAKATWKAIAAPFRLIEQANILAERGIRVGVFRKLRNEGIESLEAAIRSRDATVDFAKSGHTMRTINAILPFTNAAIQGQANIARTIWNHPGRSAAFAGMFMSAVVLERVNNMRFETSSLIPDYEYTRNWIIQFAEGRRKDGTQYPIYLRIPKGEIAAMATFIPEAIAHLARDGEDRSMVELMLDQGFEVAKIISPIDVGQPTELIPPIGGTAIGASFGINPFTRAPLVPLGEKDLPPEQQFGDRTSTLAVQLGQQFNVSPRKIDFALRDVAAGTGQQVSWLVSMALEALMGRPPELGIDDPDADVRAEGTERLSQTNPFVSRFVGIRSTQLDRRGYSNLDNAKTATQRVFGALPDVSRLGVKLGVVGSTIEGVDLTPQQRAEYQGMMGAEVVRELETFIHNPEFQALEDIEKENHIRTALRIGKDVASGIMGARIAGQQPVDTTTVTPTPTARPSTLTPEERQKVQDFLSRTKGGSTRGTTQGQSLKERAREIVGAK